MGLFISTLAVIITAVVTWCIAKLVYSKVIDDKEQRLSRCVDEIGNLSIKCEKQKNDIDALSHAKKLDEKIITSIKDRNIKKCTYVILLWALFAIKCSKFRKDIKVYKYKYSNCYKLAITLGKNNPFHITITEAIFNMANVEEKKDYTFADSDENVVMAIISNYLKL